MDVILLKLTALLYLFATGSFICYVFLIRESVAKLSLGVLAAGFLLHSAAIGFHVLQTGYPNITQFREALSFYSWLMVAGFLVVQFKYRLTILGSIIAPLAFMMTLGEFAFGPGREELPAGLKSYWLAIHVSLAFLGNAAFALAFGVSLI
jgi:ABC-type transport system involved in cytochrome c biogenesis permease subunit